jgi:2-amino-4-hydroxy-6-hydroxymethyldihydropteridine diphosphokinase
VLAYVGLGANLGNPAVQLQAALKALGQLPETQLLAASPCYRTPAIGPAGQPDYCNAVAQLATTLAPQTLLEALLEIEIQAGRVRGERWGARVLDLDLLLHGDSVCQTATLTLPHPQIQHRNFVLKPLADLSPALIIPGLGRVQDLLAQLPQTPIELWT